MYETLMHTLRSFFSAGFLRITLMVCLGVSVVVLAMNMSGPFRSGLAAWRERKGWRGVLATLGAGTFKAMLIFVLARLFITALLFQGQLFGQHHGRITGRNRSAVLMKWGYPHEQHELSVSHTRKRTWVTRQLQVQDKSQRVFTESYWKDEAPPVQAVNGTLPKVLNTREELRDVAVIQKSIVSADVAITVTNNPRTLGNANYAGYNDSWQLRYTVANKSQWQTTAHMSFALPARTGLFDSMILRVDGKDFLDNVASTDSALCWALTLEPQSTCTVELGYQSRGLEHLRYIPKRMTQTGHYRVAMTIHGIPPAKLDYPIGSMPPAEDLAALQGEDYTLTWKLDNALTSYDIGIKLPVAEQPDYHFAHLLAEAPVGLVWLFILLTVPRLILGRPVPPDLLLIFGVAYCLHYTFMGHLADLMTGFALPFATSAAVLVLAMGWYRLRGSETCSLGVQDTVMFVVAAVLYPLAVIDSELTALWIQLFTITALIFFCVLVVARRCGRRQAVSGKG